MVHSLKSSVGLNQVSYLHKVGVLGITDSYNSMHFLYQLLFLIIIKLHVPFGQPCLPCSILDEDKADLYDKMRKLENGGGDRDRKTLNVRENNVTQEMLPILTKHKDSLFWGQNCICIPDAYEFINQTYVSHVFRYIVG